MAKEPVGFSQKQVWLCRCVDRVYGTPGWAENQQARQWSRQVSAEHWTSLEHEHLLKLTYFPPAVLAVYARR